MREQIQQRAILCEPQGMIVGCFYDGSTEMNIFGQAADASQKEQWIGHSTVKIEMMLGKPDRVKAQSISRYSLTFNLLVKLWQRLLRENVEIIEKRKTHKLLLKNYNYESRTG